MSRNSSFLLALGAVLVFQAGCDQAHDQYAQMASDQEPIIVFAPGFKVQIAGNTVPVFGFDDCPQQGAAMTKLFGESSIEGSQKCIVLRNDRATVSVQIASATGLMTEKWKVIRETLNSGDRPYSVTRLQRPDGSYVVPAKSQVST